MDEEALHQQGDQFTSTNYEHTSSTLQEKRSQHKPSSLHLHKVQINIKNSIYITRFFPVSTYLFVSTQHSCTVTVEYNLNKLHHHIQI